MNRRIILVLGPTAGGKTALAIDLANRLAGGGECICADSMQIYRGMDIGTAKPTPDEQAQVPHHLLDIADPSDDTFSVDRWLELADQAIESIRQRGRWPIIVGGTNLYVRAFLQGMMEGPEPDPALRQQLQEISLDQLRAWLERVDPKAASRIHLNDRKRTIRAIEVFERTGRKISELQTQWTDGKPASDSLDSAQPQPRRIDQSIIVGLEYPVEVINRRINARVKAMIDAGFVEEVRTLHSAGKVGRNAREALGYKQIIEHLEGRCSLDDAIEQIKIRTRRYAKQQRAWLRRFRTLPNSFWFAAGELEPQRLADQALDAIKKCVADTARVAPVASESN